MATKSFKELMTLSKDELSTRIRETESEIFKNRMQHKTGQLKDTATLWRLRKRVARMKTLLTSTATK